MAARIWLHVPVVFIFVPGRGRSAVDGLFVLDIVTTTSTYLHNLRVLKYFAKIGIVGRRDVPISRLWIPTLALSRNPDFFCILPSSHRINEKVKEKTVSRGVISG